ncbi:choline-phosphate cytidylyltransferase [Strigomonas culicis]|nr:choline-phosphate cytidylyltransferase [Strigomonas culicis]|eukprot:EPY36580.1 choline-phosphate cytidylyltransferase [Strigomonas culicis]
MSYASIWESQRTVQTATVVAALLMIVAIVCGSLDGVHAKRCRSATSLGDIFSRICSSVSRIFMALTLLEVFQVTTIATKWYVLLTLQLIELNTVLGRINANNLKKEKVKNWAYVATYCFRDSELSFVMLLLLLLRWLCPTYTSSVMQQIDTAAARRGYILLVLLSFVNIAALKMRKRNKTGIILCLATRVVPIFYLLPLSEYNILSVLSDALVVGLLSVEVYVSDLAHRRVHAAVMGIIVGSLFNDVVTLAGSIMYLTAVLVDLSYVLNVPLFVPVCNVYIDGVFDLCHAGHKLMMANALRFGNRLIVGVCGDDECEHYKRRPIMTTEERVKEVALCRYVSEVVPDAPVSGITAEMIKYYNVHIVVCGEEYNTPQDTYYAVPRQLGMLRTAPRTEGISTSELIKRIRAASDEDTAARDKLNGASTVKDSQ